MTEGVVETRISNAVTPETSGKKELVGVYPGRSEDGGILSVLIPTNGDVIEERRRSREGLPPVTSTKSVNLEFKAIPPTNTILTLQISGHDKYSYERFVPSNLNPAEKPLHRYPDAVFMRRLTSDDMDRLRQENPNLSQEPLSKYLTDPVLKEFPAQ